MGGPAGSFLTEEHTVRVLLDLVPWSLRDKGILSRLSAGDRRAGSFYG